MVDASLSDPHHVGLTVKSVFLLAYLLDTLPYMAKNLTMTTSSTWSANQLYIKRVEC